VSRHGYATSVESYVLKMVSPLTPALSPLRGEGDALYAFGDT